MFRFIIVGVFLLQSAYAFNDRSCLKDSDCVAVPTTVCGCRSGGKARAVHREQKNSWIKQFQSADVACVAMMSTHWTCARREIKCLEKRCKLVRIPPPPDFSKFSSDQCAGVEFEDDKNLCFYTTALEYEKSFLCQKITHQSEKRLMCYQMLFEKIKKNPKKLTPIHCQNLGIREKKDCIKILAHANEDISTCDMLINNAQRKSCKTEIFQTLYKLKADPEFCLLNKKNVSRGEVDICLSEMAKKTGNSKDCRGISKENYPLFYKCVRDIARLSKDPNQCKVLYDRQNDIPSKLKGLPNYSVSFCRSLKVIFNEHGDR